jgi:hypothetical protein
VGEQLDPRIPRRLTAAVKETGRLNFIGAEREFFLREVNKEAAAPKISRGLNRRSVLRFPSTVCHNVRHSDLAIAEKARPQVRTAERVGRIVQVGARCAPRDRLCKREIERTLHGPKLPKRGKPRLPQCSGMSPDRSTGVAQLRGVRTYQPRRVLVT